VNFAADGDKPGVDKEQLVDECRGPFQEFFDGVVIAGRY
jgi:hypothetical protein